MIVQARLWVQVIHELRSGLKLKKIEYTKTPIGTTPILISRIFSKKFSGFFHKKSTDFFALILYKMNISFKICIHFEWCNIVQSLS